MKSFLTWTKIIFKKTIKSLYYITIGWIVLCFKVLKTNINKWLNGSKNEDNTKNN